MAFILIGAGAVVDVKDKDGITALLSAASLRRPDVVRKLLEAGANVRRAARESRRAGKCHSRDGVVHGLCKGCFHGCFGLFKGNCR